MTWQPRLGERIKVGNTTGRVVAVEWSVGSGLSLLVSLDESARVGPIAQRSVRCTPDELAPIAEWRAVVGVEGIDAN